jgi:hypothetical protein
MLLEDRERAEEALFVHRQELAFTAHARRNKLFGLWAAQLSGLADEPARRYAMAVTLEDFPHFRASAVLARVARDLDQCGHAVAEEALAIALAQSADRAQEEVLADSGTHLGG